MTKEREAELAEVRDANESFYEALSSLDVDRMEQVWSRAREARCIHPGWDVLMGWKAICDSWRSIFASSSGLAVEAEEVEISLYGDLAWVHCLERIRNAVEESDHVSLARATNLFVRENGTWRMVLHHASPIPMSADTGDTGAVH